MVRVSEQPLSPAAVELGYREWNPPAALERHAACLWACRRAPARVLPDGCTDLIWNGERLVIAGPASGPVLPQAPGARVGIRLRVGAAGAALGVPASELAGVTPPASDVWPEARHWEELLTATARPRQRLALLTRLVTPKLAGEEPPDPVVREAVSRLARPRPRIAAVARHVALSERALRRHFGEAVGYSPRMTLRVLRLQRFLAAAERGGDLAALAAQVGYADQAHLTRECSALAGAPPGALLSSSVLAAGERLS